MPKKRSKILNKPADPSRIIGGMPLIYRCTNVVDDDEIFTRVLMQLSVLLYPVLFTFSGHKYVQ